MSGIPDELKSKASIAAQHVRANQLAEALALYTEMLAGKADLFTIAVERGKVYQQTTDHLKAIADFTSAVDLRGDHFEAFFRRCVSHHDTGAFQKEMNDCAKAIKLNPVPFEYYYYRGLAHTALRLWDKAAADLAAATERKNEQPEAHLQLGQRPGFAEAYKGRSSVKSALGHALGSQEDLSKVSR